LFDTQNKNEFNPSGINGSGSFAGRLGIEYPVGKLAVIGYNKLRAPTNISDHGIFAGLHF
jgi:hypothetical protein